MNDLNNYLRVFVGLVLTMSVTLNNNFTEAAQKQSKKQKTVAISEGTSDGAGGNSFNRKMLESYVFHPETSPAFSPKIADIIKTIFSSPEDKNNGLDIFKIKTWYLAPKSLKPIDKKILGIDFVNGGVEQVAIQNDSEVWVDAKIYNGMLPEEQSTLILHEAVMTYYLFQFLKFTDLCLILERATEENRCSNVGSAISEEQINKQFPPQPLRSLNEGDYQNIRFMTNWLLEQGAKLTQKRFWQVARASGFDKRFTNPDEDKKESKNPSGKVDRQSLSTDEFLLKLESGRYSNTLPRKCHSSDTNKIYDCEVSWMVEELENPYGANQPKLKYLTLKISEAKTHKEIIGTSMYLSSVIELYSTSSLGGEKKFYMYGMFGGSFDKNLPFNVEKINVGERLTEVGFSFDEKLESVVGISMAPYVLAGKIKIIKDKDDSRDINSGSPNSAESISEKQECNRHQYVRYQGESKYTEGVTMTETQEILDYRNLFRASGKTIKLDFNCK